MVIFDCFFNPAVFSNQPGATGTLPLPKDSHPRKYCRNLYRLIFQRPYPKTNRIAPGTSTGRLRAAYMRNSVSGHSSRFWPFQPTPTAAPPAPFPVLVPRIAPEALAGTLKAGFSPKVARVHCSWTRRVGKKSDRSLGRDSSLMRIVFRIGLLTRAVQTDNATKFLQNTFMVKCHRTPPIHEYAEKLSLSS